MSLVQTVAPTAEPVTLAELKSALDYEDSDRDAELTDWLIAARTYVEEYLWSQLATATWRWKIDRLPLEMVIPRGPLIAVSSIAYLDDNGDSQTMSSSVYQVVTGFPGRVMQAYNQTWPTTRLQPEAVTITYTAGYGAASAVPGPIKRAIVVLAAELFNGCELNGVPPAVSMMLSPYRSRVGRAAECVA